MKLLYSYIGRLFANILTFSELASILQRIISPDTNKCRPVYFRQVFLLPVFCFTLLSYVHAQSPDRREADARQIADSRAINEEKGIKPLIVGQKVPEDFWTKEYLFYLNGDTTRKTLEEYRGKPILLDFWATWCGGCIANFSKLERLQELFSDELNVLLVNASYTTDTFEKIEKSHQNTVPSQWSGKIPTVILDDYLSGRFPHIAVPFYVWLSKNGVVKALTRSSFVGVNEVNNYLEH